LTFQYTDLSIFNRVFRENYSVVIFAQPSGPLFTPTDRPTGHCPNARMASPPLHFRNNMVTGISGAAMLETAVQDLATIGLIIAKNISFLTKIVTLVQIFYLERDAIPKYLHHEIHESLVIIQRCCSKLSNFAADSLTEVHFYYLHQGCCFTWCLSVCLISCKTR